MREYYDEENRMNMEALEEQFGELVNAPEDSLLEDMQENSLGRLLRMMAALPEIREDKVIHARRQICRQDFELDEHLDRALDRVLEELISD